MYLTLNPDAPEPLFEQLRGGIVRLIAQGTLQDGDKLDSVRRVAASFGINPATVKKAYDQLVDDGLVETAGRSGSIVRAGARTPAQRQHLSRDLDALRLRASAQGFDNNDILDILKELA